MTVPGGKKLPAGTITQLCAPAEGVKKPVAHGWHTVGVLGTKTEKLPLAHRVQTLPSTKDVEPEAQGLQTPEPAELEKPALQFVQAVEPARAAIVPAAHALQAGLPARGDNVPTAQIEQPLVPAALSGFGPEPAAQGAPGRVTTCDNRKVDVVSVMTWAIGTPDESETKTLLG